MRSENTALMTVILGGLREGLALLALGLIVSLTAMWYRKYLLTQVRGLDSDMENASLQLLNDLASTNI
jgi:biopolymer transport protein ExbB/TolQ